MFSRQDLVDGLALQMRVDNMSRAELARRLGVSRASVTGYFSVGPRGMGLGTMVRICNALGYELVVKGVGDG